MKHLKSSLRDLRQLFDRGVTARYLAEPFICFDGPRLANEVRAFMHEKDFDIVGVRRNGAVVGYVARDDLVAGTLDEYVRALESADLLDETTPLVQIINRLTERPRVLIEIMGQPSGIITKGDLQKAPIRMWLFGLLSLLEMQLLRLIRFSYPNESWVPLLSNGRVEKVRELWQDRRRRNEALDLLDCLQFADKRTLVAKTEALRELLGFESRQQAEQELERLERLRDELAHAQDIVSGRWPELAQVARAAERILERCEAAG